MADSLSTGDEDSLYIQEVGEQSLWILSGKTPAVDVDQQNAAGGEEVGLSKSEQSIKRLTLEVEALRNEKDDITKQMKLGKKQKEDQISSLKRKLLVKQQELDTSKSEAKSLLLVLRQEQTKQDDELKTLELTNASFKKEISDLKTQLLTERSEKTELARELEQLKEKLVKVEYTMSSQAEENAKLQKEAEKVKELQQARGNDGKTRTSRLKGELDDLRRQLQVKSAQVEDLGREKEQLVTETVQLQDKLLKMQQARASLADDSEAKQFQITQLTARLVALSKELEQKTREGEQLRQELTCAQENIAELMGAASGAKYGQSASSTGTGDTRAGENCDHICPVCDKSLPGRISQREFERHVNSHFD